VPIPRPADVLDARQSTLLGPTAIAIHDHRDVPRQRGLASALRCEVAELIFLTTDYAD